MVQMKTEDQIGMGITLCYNLISVFFYFLMEITTRIFICPQVLTLKSLIIQ